MCTYELRVFYEKESGNKPVKEIDNKIYMTTEYIEWLEKKTSELMKITNVNIDLSNKERDEQIELQYIKHNGKVYIPYSNVILRGVI